MSDFNFSLQNYQPASTTAYLKPYNIYNDVEVSSIELKSGTSAAGNNWKCLKVTFKNDQGIHVENIWFPMKESDFTRREVDGANGGKRQLCSNVEVAMAWISTIASTFNPEGFKKMQEISSKFKSFDQVAEAFMKVMSKATVKTSMKLVGRVNDNRTYARLPQPIGINQNSDGEWEAFPVRIFGDNLTFSTYELGKKKEYESAKSTKVEETKDPLGVDSTDEDIDIDQLL